MSNSKHSPVEDAPLKKHYKPSPLIPDSYSPVYSRHTVHVVVPVFNEEGNILHVLEEVARLLADRTWHIVVVDDGSTDTSIDVINEFAKQYPESVHVIQHISNQGAPQALFDGYKEAVSQADNEDCLVCIEGDGTSDLNILTSLVGHVFQNFDVVIASRYRPGGTIIGFPPFRKLVSRFGNFLLRTAFPHPQVSDFSIFYRAYRVKFVRSVLNAANGTNVFAGYHFDGNTAFLLRCLTYDPKICEVPHRYTYSRKKSASSFRLRPIALGFIKMLLSPCAAEARVICRKRRRLQTRYNRVHNKALNPHR